MRSRPLWCGIIPRHDRHVHSSRIFVRSLVPLLILLAGEGCRENAGFADPARLKPNEVAVLPVHPVSAQLDLDATVGVTFSRDLATAAGLQPGDVGESFGRWAPDLPGTRRWATPDRLEFFPDGRYAPNTTYTLTIDPRVARDAELSLKGRRLFTFTADPFELEHAQLVRRRTSDDVQAYEILGTFSFNCPVDPADFSRHVSLGLARRGAVPFEIVTTEACDVISVRTEAIAVTEEAEILTVVLKSGLPAAQGDGTLTGTVERQVEIPARRFLIVEKLELVNTLDAREVRLELSHPVNVTALREALSIDPPVEQLEVIGQGRAVLLRGAWVHGCRYAVTIAASLVAVDGYPLERGFHGSVYVGSLSPSLEIPGEGNYLSLRGEQRIAVESVNIERFTVKLSRVYANNLVPYFQSRRLDADHHYSWRSLDQVGAVLYEEEVDHSPDHPGG